MMQTRRVSQRLQCVKRATSQRRPGTWSIFLVVISSPTEIALTMVSMQCAHSAGWTSVTSWMAFTFVVLEVFGCNNIESHP